MREVICKVSGQIAEAKNSQTIRISDARNNHPRDGQAKLLLHSGFGQADVFQSRSRFSGPFNTKGGHSGSVPTKAGDDAGKISPGYRRGSSLEGQTGTKVFIVCLIFALVAVVIAIDLAVTR